MASAPLLPEADPSLLFTTAGMNPFKSYFLGERTPPNAMLTSAQACLRAGGKHNDLDQVGYTQRHHTYFEMLGNFSFGHYGKREAITYAWQLLTSREGFHLPAECLWITVYYQDLESKALWQEIAGLPEEKIVLIGDKLAPFDSDNFWQMGETGPCGPCTEIFYDCGPQYPGTRPGDDATSGTRFVEIWNLVFMQYQRLPNQSFSPLPKLCIDTGMGLERMTAVLQQVYDNYETDLFVALKQAIARQIDHSVVNSKPSDQEIALRVIADHLRASFFMILEGITPSNQLQGYVLRRIIRRAIRYGLKLGFTDPFLSGLVGDACAILLPQPRQPTTHDLDSIASTLLQEELLFCKTLQAGLRKLQQTLATGPQPLSGEIAFKLYDTYGFPFEMTQEICREQGVSVDASGFEQALEAQRARSAQHTKFQSNHPVAGTSLIGLPDTPFVGYDDLILETQISGIFTADFVPLQNLSSGEEGYVSLNRTVFYPTSGGQIGDIGSIKSASGIFEVQETLYQGKIILHRGVLLSGTLTLGENIAATVDSDMRERTAAHHSAAHLLHSALRMHLGQGVCQAGSLVTASSLRLDFHHQGAVASETLHAIEHWVNQQIRCGQATQVLEVSLAIAKEIGAIGLFEQKYAEKEALRVVVLNDDCKELCGGTHVKHLSQVGYFKILSETGLAQGIRRIEACAGRQAVEMGWGMREDLIRMAQMLKVPTSGVFDQIRFRLDEINRLKEQAKSRSRSIGEWLFVHHAQPNIYRLGDYRLAINVLPISDLDTLKAIAQRLVNEQNVNCATMIGSDSQGSKIVVLTDRQSSARLDASQLLQRMQKKYVIQGGGKSHFAQGIVAHPEESGNLAGFLKEIFERFILEPSSNG